jgi:hypothetical protein
MLSNACLSIAIQNINGLDRTDAFVLDCLGQGNTIRDAQSALDCVGIAIGLSDRQLKSKQSVYFQFILWSTVSAISSLLI